MYHYKICIMILLNKLFFQKLEDFILKGCSDFKDSERFMICSILCFE